MPGLSMSTDYFLKIQDIAGESVRKGKEEHIEMLSWSFGCSQAGTAELGSGLAGSGRVSMNDFHFSKLSDKSSPKLLQHLFTGKYIPKAWAYARRIGLEGAEPLDYFVIEFEQLIISSCGFGGTGDGDVPSENVSFRFAKVKFHYREIKEGKPQGPISGGWDVKLNKVY